MYSSGSRLWVAGCRPTPRRERPVSVKLRTFAQRRPKVAEPRHGDCSDMTSTNPKLYVVFGATGNTGMEVVPLLLEAGHAVRAFARTPSKMTLTHEKLEVVKGEVGDANAVRAAIKGADAVISLVGGPLGDKSFHGGVLPPTHQSGSCRHARARGQEAVGANGGGLRGAGRTLQFFQACADQAVGRKKKRRPRPPCRQ